MKVYELIALLRKTDQASEVVVHDHGTDWALGHIQIRKIVIGGTGAVVIAADPEAQRHFNGLRGTPYEVIK